MGKPRYLPAGCRLLITGVILLFTSITVMALNVAFAGQGVMVESLSAFDTFLYPEPGVVLSFSGTAKTETASGQESLVELSGGRVTACISASEVQSLISESRLEQLEQVDDNGAWVGIIDLPAYGVELEHCNPVASGRVFHESSELAYIVEQHQTFQPFGKFPLNIRPPENSSTAFFPGLPNQGDFYESSRGGYGGGRGQDDFPRPPGGGGSFDIGSGFGLQVIPAWLAPLLVVSGALPPEAVDPDAPGVWVRIFYEVNGQQQKIELFLSHSELVYFLDGAPLTDLRQLLGYLRNKLSGKDELLAKLSHLQEWLGVWLIATDGEQFASDDDLADRVRLKKLQKRLRQQLQGVMEQNSPFDYQFELAFFEQGVSKYPPILMASDKPPGSAQGNNPGGDQQANKSRGRGRGISGLSGSGNHQSGGSPGGIPPNDNSQKQPPGACKPKPPWCSQCRQDRAEDYCTKENPYPLCQNCKASKKRAAIMAGWQHDHAGSTQQGAKSQQHGYSRKKTAQTLQNQFSQGAIELEFADQDCKKARNYLCRPLTHREIIFLKSRRLLHHNKRILPGQNRWFYKNGLNRERHLLLGELYRIHVIARESPERGIELAEQFYDEYLLNLQSHPDLLDHLSKIWSTLAIPRLQFFLEYLQSPDYDVIKGFEAIAELILLRDQLGSRYSVDLFKLLSRKAVSTALNRAVRLLATTKDGDLAFQLAPKVFWVLTSSSKRTIIDRTTTGTLWNQLERFIWRLNRGYPSATVWYPARIYTPSTSYQSGLQWQLVQHHSRKSLFFEASQVSWQSVIPLVAAVQYDSWGRFLFDPQQDPLIEKFRLSVRGVLSEVLNEIDVVNPLVLRNMMQQFNDDLGGLVFYIFPEHRNILMWLSRDLAISSPLLQLTRIKDLPGFDPDIYHPPAESELEHLVNPSLQVVSDLTDDKQRSAVVQMVSVFRQLTVLGASYKEHPFFKRLNQFFSNWLVQHIPENPGTPEFRQTMRLLAMLPRDFMLPGQFAEYETHLQKQKLLSEAQYQGSFQHANVNEVKPAFVADCNRWIQAFPPKWLPSMQKKWRQANRQNLEDLALLIENKQFSEALEKLETEFFPDFPLMAVEKAAGSYCSMRRFKEYFVTTLKEMTETLPQEDDELRSRLWFIADWLLHKADAGSQTNQCRECLKRLAGRVWGEKEIPLSLEYPVSFTHEFATQQELAQESRSIDAWRLQVILMIARGQSFQALDTVIRLLNSHAGHRIALVNSGMMVRMLGWVLDSVLVDLVVAFQGEPEEHQVARFRYLEKHWHHLHLMYKVPPRHQKTVRWLRQRLVDHPYIPHWHSQLITASNEKDYSELTNLLTLGPDSATSPWVMTEELKQLQRNALQGSINQLVEQINTRLQHSYVAKETRQVLEQLKTLEQYSGELVHYPGLEQAWRKKLNQQQQKVDEFDRMVEVLKTATSDDGLKEIFQHQKLINTIQQLYHKDTLLIAAWDDFINLYHRFIQQQKGNFESELEAWDFEQARASLEMLNTVSPQFFDGKTEQITELQQQLKVREEAQSAFLLELQTNETIDRIEDIRLWLERLQRFDDSLMAAHAPALREGLNNVVQRVLIMKPREYWQQNSRELRHIEEQVIPAIQPLDEQLVIVMKTHIQEVRVSLMPSSEHMLETLLEALNDADIKIRRPESGSSVTDQDREPEGRMDIIEFGKFLHAELSRRLDDMSSGRTEASIPSESLQSVRRQLESGTLFYTGSYHAAFSLLAETFNILIYVDYGAMRSNNPEVVYQTGYKKPVSNVVKDQLPEHMTLMWIKGNWFKDLTHFFDQTGSIPPIPSAARVTPWDWGEESDDDVEVTLDSEQSVQESLAIPTSLPGSGLQKGAASEFDWLQSNLPSLTLHPVTKGGDCLPEAVAQGSNALAKNSNLSQADVRSWVHLKLSEIVTFVGYFSRNHRRYSLSRRAADKLKKQMVEELRSLTGLTIDELHIQLNGGYISRSAAEFREDQKMKAWFDVGYLSVAYLLVNGPVEVYLPGSTTGFTGPNVYDAWYWRATAPSLTKYLEQARLIELPAAENKRSVILVHNGELEGGSHFYYATGKPD